MGYLTVIVVVGLAGWCVTAVFRQLGVGVNAGRTSNGSMERTVRCAQS
jgi:hypothetical protein